MEENKLTISIGHLYPKHLNLGGDIGNIITLKKRCQWRGIDAQITEINIGEDIPECDFYYIGSGEYKQEEEVAAELYTKKNVLQKMRDKNSVFLGINGGFKLLGKYYQPLNNEHIKCADLLDIYTIAGKKRFTGNITSKTELTTPNTLVGFENHSDLTYIQGETSALATTIIGKGNNGEDNKEGARFKNVFGTYILGPFLAKNSHFADYLIELALEKRYGKKITLQELNDKIEVETHLSLINKNY